MAEEISDEDRMVGGILLQAAIIQGVVAGVTARLERGFRHLPLRFKDDVRKGYYLGTITIPTHDPGYHFMLTGETLTDGSLRLLIKNAEGNNIKEIILG